MTQIIKTRNEKVNVITNSSEYGIWRKYANKSDNLDELINLRKKNLAKPDSRL